MKKTDKKTNKVVPKKEAVKDASKVESEKGLSGLLTQQEVLIVRDKLAGLDPSWVALLAEKMNVEQSRVRSIVSGLVTSNPARAEFILKGKLLYDELNEVNLSAKEAVSAIAEVEYFKG